MVLCRTILTEPPLPLDLQVSLELLHLLLEALVLGDQGGHGLSFRVQLSVKHLQVFVLLIGGQNEAAQTGASQVRTVTDMRTPMLVFGIEDELHRPPFRRDAIIPYANTASRASPACHPLGSKR
jgi:hypothetical protein